MTDHELLQTALDALKHLCLHTAAIRGYDAEQVQTAIDALKARLAQPEPVIYARKEGDLIVVDLPQVKTGGGGISNDSAKKEWVGLTDDEVDDIGCDFATLGGDIEGKNWFAFYLAIEAKLKEKNSTTVMNIQTSDKND